LLKPLVVGALIEQMGSSTLATTLLAPGDLGSSLYPSILASFQADRSLTLEEVCAFSIITSDNPSADFLWKRAGASAVADHAAGLGMTATRVVVGFSDAELGAAGRRNVSTAEDVASLFTHLYAQRHEQPALWRWLVNSLRNNRIPGELPDEVQVANKTGTLLGVANDAGVILGRRPLLMVVLTDEQADTAVTSLEIARMAAEVAAATKIL
jgi:beta-lactamase class A